jgi:hypothetical protein
MPPDTGGMNVSCCSISFSMPVTNTVSMPIQVRNQPIPISLAKAAGLNQPRLVGQDLFGLLQGVGVFVDDGVVAGGLFVFGDPQ